MQTIGELVRKSETDFISGTTQISKYVQHSMHNTLERIDAYSNSKHISGETDSLGREKPFFNISVAASNVWYRATDIDRSHITVRATKKKDWINSFLATIHLRDWMRREMFGQFLNEWGRTLAKYGSAVVKFVESDGELHVSVVPWSRLIVDAVDFDANPKIEIIELTEADLYKRIDTHGYDEEKVEELIEARKARETVDKKKKDNKNDYIKLYEVHGELPLSMLTRNEDDKREYARQMHVVSFVGTKTGSKIEHKDFTLFSAREDKERYMITHLIKEDGRTLSIGSIEHLFEAQWMINHSIKSIKDELDLASKMLFQTADTQFVGRNVSSNVETGDILIHTAGQPLTQLNNQALNAVAQQNYSTQWKQLGNEITGVSESMLGAAPKSGTAWRQTEAVLQESHSLFELMTENKSLDLEFMLRTHIIPHLKKKMDTSDEVTATLEQHEIDRIDSAYIKNKAIKETNKQLKEKVLSGVLPEQGEQEMLMEQNALQAQESIQGTGNQRFFKPSELDDKTWKKQFEDMEWDLEINITGEAFDAQQALTTLNTALKLVVTPGFEQNKKAQTIVGRILELTGTLSPIEWNAIPSPMQPQQQEGAKPPEVSTGVLPELNK